MIQLVQKKAARGGTGSRAEPNTVERNSAPFSDRALGRATGGEPIAPPFVVGQPLALSSLARREGDGRIARLGDGEGARRGGSTDHTGERHSFLGLRTPSECRPCASYLIRRMT